MLQKIINNYATKINKKICSIVTIQPAVVMLQNCSKNNEVIMLQKKTKLSY